MSGHFEVGPRVYFPSMSISLRGLGFQSESRSHVLHSLSDEAQGNICTPSKTQAWLREAEDVDVGQ